MAVRIIRYCNIASVMLWAWPVFLADRYKRGRRGRR